MVDDETREKLIEMCVEIDAHNQLDWEVNMAGNGTNPSEASNVAREVLNHIGVKPSSRFYKTRVAKRVKELKSETEVIEEEDASLETDNQGKRPKSKRKKTIDIWPNYPEYHDPSPDDEI